MVPGYIGSQCQIGYHRSYQKIGKSCENAAHRLTAVSRGEQEKGEKKKQK
jgi:hypothetical protein